MKFRKTLRIVLVILLNFALYINLVSAVSLSPSSGNMRANSTYTINIIAAPPSGASGVQVRLVLTGAATVTGYTAPTGSEWGPGAIGTCTGSTTYTSSEVCVDLANTGTITSGESLGSFKILTQDSGTISISRDTDNAYLVGSTLNYQSGTVGSYTIGGTISLLPDTAITDNPGVLVIISALIIILVGVAIYLIGTNRKNLIIKRNKLEEQTSK